MGAEYTSTSRPHHCRTRSGLVMASNTTVRGALNRRVIRISRSDGLVTWKLSLFAVLLPIMVFLSFIFSCSTYASNRSSRSAATCALTYEERHFLAPDTNAQQILSVMIAPAERA